MREKGVRAYSIQLNNKYLESRNDRYEDKQQQKTTINNVEADIFSFETLDIKRFKTLC